MGLCLTGARPDFSIIMGVPVHVRVKRRSYVYWFGAVHQKKEYVSWETNTCILVYNVHQKKEYTNWETHTGILVYNVLFEKSDFKITHGTDLKLEER